MTSICVFCGSSPGQDPSHMALAHALGLALAKANIRMIYGGGGLGLMGAAAQAARSAGAEVLGIIPHFLTKAEKSITDVPHERVGTMAERKNVMYEKSDAFIVLPGGIGTLEEAVEILSWARLELHSKPLVFLDNTEYWQPILQGFSHFIEQGFAPESFAADILYAATPQEALTLINDKLQRRAKV